MTACKFSHFARSHARSLCCGINGHALLKIAQAERNDASSRSLSFAKIHIIIETTNK